MILRVWRTHRGIGKISAELVVAVVVVEVVVLVNPPAQRQVHARLTTVRRCVRAIRGLGWSFCGLGHHARSD